LSKTNGTSTAAEKAVGTNGTNGSATARRRQVLNSFGSPYAPHVLVVDDLRENSDLLRAFLTPKGFAVTAAYSGGEALDAVKNDPPDVILLDLVMPDMNGFEVCRRVKEDPHTRHIPVIVITGLAERDANVESIEAGADDFLLKPFDAVLLEARIRACLRTKMLQDQIMSYQDQLVESNHSLELCVRERTAQLVRTQQVTVFSLAKLAESRDTETGEHLERMRCYAREVALHLREKRCFPELSSDSFVDALYQSSPLHDIGKVGIPDRILLKPGKLSREEFTIMKSHTLIGGDTLRAADIEAGQESFLAMGRDIAYFHHERWDGTGYPMGLKGHQIPLAARIVAVGDVYDALTSKRPYKKAFSHEESRQIILEGRGTHFDPVIVDAFAACESNITVVRERFQDSGGLPPLVSVVNSLERAAEEEEKAAASKPD
jgi:putative two-component system response regulator